MRHFHWRDLSQASYIICPSKSHQMGLSYKIISMYALKQFGAISASEIKHYHNNVKTRIHTHTNHVWELMCFFLTFKLTSFISPCMENVWSWIHHFLHTDISTLIRHKYIVLHQNTNQLSVNVFVDFFKHYSELSNLSIAKSLTNLQELLSWNECSGSNDLL